MENWELSEALETGISHNVYVAVTLGLIAHRNVMIKSDGWDRSIYEIVWILRTCWCITDVKVIRLSSSLNEDDDNVQLNQLLEETKEKVVVMVGIDLLDEVRQRILRNWLRKRQESEMCIGMIALDNAKYTRSSRKDHLSSLLVQEFWISQNHQIGNESKNTTDYNSIKPNELFHNNKLVELHASINDIRMVPEMYRYTYDIVIHLRTHRCVHKGLATNIITELQLLSKTLCVLFNKEFVIPTIVKLATRKLVPFHLILVPPELEPTLIYGSDPDIVRELMLKITEEKVVEGVLKNVGVPL